MIWLGRRDGVIDFVVSEPPTETSPSVDVHHSQTSGPATPAPIQRWCSCRGKKSLKTYLSGRRSGRTRSSRHCGWRLGRRRQRPCERSAGKKQLWSARVIADNRVQQHPIDYIPKLWRGESAFWGMCYAGAQLTGQRWQCQVGQQKGEVGFADERFSETERQCPGELRVT